MKDYSLMSDFDINHSVLSSMKIDGRIFDKPHFADGSSVGIHYEIGDRYEWFDYCNNPSDAWPIIDKEMISINRHYDGSYSLVWGYCDGGMVEVKCLAHEILRSAMIVYLMMKDEWK